MVQKNNGAFRNIRRLEKHTDDDRPFIYGRFCMLSVFSGCLALQAVFQERGDTDAGKLPPAAGTDSNQSGGLSAQHAPDLRCNVLQCH